VLPRRRCAGRAALACLVCAALNGCASFTNPVAEGVPAHLISPEYLGRPREEEKTIPLPWLRQKPPDIYRLDSGDVLGVYIEGVLGDRTQPPPVRFGEQGNVPPAFGFPIPVEADGKLPLPLISPLSVKDMSVLEAQEAVIKAYTTGATPILDPTKGKPRIVVTLIRPRQIHVLVVRQDSGGLVFGPGGVLGGTKRGTGASIELPAYENDVLNALTRTGGLPGLDAMNEVIIERGAAPADGSVPACPASGDSWSGEGGQFVRIPLRLRPGTPPPFQPDQVVLHDGDIVFIEARDTEVFYTGGLLPPRQFVLPRDYDLRVVDAVALVAGPLVNGGFNQNNLNGTIQATGLGSPSPSLISIIRRVKGYGQLVIKVDLNLALRDQRENLLIQAGDVIILQETPLESFNRYFNTVFRLNFLGTFIRQRDMTGTGNVNLF
jgi:protein involved in polysaccharide export with SLBB domain